VNETITLLEPPAPNPARESPETILNRIELSGEPSSPSQALEQVSIDRTVVQDFRPVSESLEWELSARYWATQGLKPFIEEAVPYAINNSGWASENAAAVLFANCLESNHLSDQIRVLELGAGIGLFARQFLDAFRELCHQAQTDFYDRLIYYVTDHSATTIQQWVDHRVFAPHDAHAVLARCNAMEPLVLSHTDGQTTSLAGLQAVFANYILDSLPVSIVRRQGGQAQQLHIRTHLSKQYENQIKQETSLTYDQIVSLADTKDPSEKARLLPVLPFMEFEADFRPDGADRLLHVQAVLDDTPDSKRAVLNHGAIRCLGACLDALDPGGLILVNDYGPTQVDQVDGMAHVMRFGASLACCLHFPFLERHFSSLGWAVHKPKGDDDRMIHSRLFCKPACEGTVRSFHDQCGDDRYTKADRICSAAVEHINAGRLHGALDCYKQAIGYCPRDWHLLGQAAEFLTQHLLRYDEALQLAQAAIAINPWYSSFLWNTLGNSLFCLNRFDEAHQAYQQALGIDPNDPQGHLNLAFTYIHHGDCHEALTAIARGLENDQSGRFRSVLLSKQQEIIGILANRRTANQQRLEQRNTVFRSVR